MKERGERPLIIVQNPLPKKISTLAPEVVPEAPRGCEQSRSLADIGCSTIAERFQTSHVCAGVLRVSILTLELGNLEAWKVLGHVGFPRLLHTRLVYQLQRNIRISKVCFPIRASYHLSQLEP